MKRTTLCLALFSVLSNGFAAELKTTADDQVALGLTVYQAGIALVREERRITLSANATDLAVGDVAARMIPESLSVSGLPVLESNYEFDVLTPASLLEKHVGEAIFVETRGDEGTTVSREKATILSVSGAGVVLRFEPSTGYPQGRIETHAQHDRYSYIYDSVPENLRTTPTLVLKLGENVSTDSDLKLEYLTEGISWSTHYVLNVDRHFSRGDMVAWVSLDNQSGKAYRGAELQLLAGDVNRARPELKMVRRMAMEVASQAADAGVSSEAIGGYHLYTYPLPVEIKNKQKKQLRLFQGSGFVLSRLLRDEAYVQPGRNVEPTVSKPSQYLAFRNSEENHLGMPMPAGLVRVYGGDAEQRSQFLGENRIGHTARNDKVQILIGKAFDVTVERKTESWEKVSKHQARFSRTVLVRNGGDTDAEVEVLEQLPTTEWRVTDIDVEAPAGAGEVVHDQAGPGTLRFTVPVPADGEVALTYSATLSFD